MPKVNLKTHLKNHALAQSLLSCVFSWEVVDVGFPTCLNGKVCPPATSAAGARGPRRGGVFPRRHVFVK
jgi:hypothetical protein